MGIQRMDHVGIVVDDLPAATEFFLEKVVPLFEAKEIGLSDTAVVAGIATLFIAASKER